jgi:DNA-binding transcriptional LysR family regulator
MCELLGVSVEQPIRLRFGWEDFVQHGSHRAGNPEGAEFKALVESRQFAPACIMVAEGYGVAVVSEIDAREYQGEGLVIRPFEPVIPFKINILYPAYKPRSIVTLEFVDSFKKSLEPFRL